MGNAESDDLAPFKRISIPLVRRIYPQLIANKIVGVQPMMPTAEEALEMAEATRRKNIKRKKYRSIDEPWEQS